MALLEYGVHINEVATISKLSSQTLYSMRKRLRERGYDPEVNTAFEDRFFKDAPRSGRPINPDSKRSARKAEKRKQSLSSVVIDHQIRPFEEAVVQEDEIIDPSLTIPLQISFPTRNINYRPAPYRKELNPKLRQEPNNKVSGNAIFVGNGWMVPAQPIPAPRIPHPVAVPLLVSLPVPNRPTFSIRNEDSANQTRRNGR